MRFPSVDVLRSVKEIVIFLGIPILLVMAIHANTIAARNTNATNKLVKNQGTILLAIKEAQDDSRLTQEQKTSIIICMLKVPQPLRTEDIEKGCRAKAAASTSGSVSQTPSGSASTKTSASSAKATPKTQPSQPDNPQPPETCKINLLGIKVNCPL